MPGFLEAVVSEVVRTKGRGVFRFFFLRAMAAIVEDDKPSARKFIYEDLAHQRRQKPVLSSPYHQRRRVQLPELAVELRLRIGDDVSKAAGRRPGAFLVAVAVIMLFDVLKGQKGRVVIWPESSLTLRIMF